MFKQPQSRITRTIAITFGLLVAFGSRGTAGDNTTTYTAVVEGSSATSRSQDDGWVGQVYIYVGGSLPTGTNLLEFRFVFDRTSGGNTTGYITPLLFEFHPTEVYTIYTLVGIGKGFEVNINSAPQTVPFDVIQGIKVPTGPNFTFGYINAIVDSGGTPVVASAGTVDYDNPTDGGHGIGGSGTANDWVCSGVTANQGPAIPIGTTFGVSGGDYGFCLPYRTYSAQAIGAVPTAQ